MNMAGTKILHMYYEVLDAMNNMDIFACLKYRGTIICLRRFDTLLYCLLFCAFWAVKLEKLSHPNGDTVTHLLFSLVFCHGNLWRFSDFVFLSLGYSLLNLAKRIVNEIG